MRFQHGELHLVLLALLELRPMHGYELMAELSERTNRRYGASPGSVYPAVQALEGEGLISSKLDADKRVFSLTRTGRDALNKRREQLAGIEARHGVRFSDDGLDAALARFTARVRSSRVEATRIERLLDRTAAEIESLSTQEGV